MRRLDNAVLAAAVLSCSLTACKSTGSSVAARVPSNSEADTAGIWRLVWADGIEQVLPPANNLPPVAKNMEGLWYCHAQSCVDKNRVGLTNGTALITLQNSNLTTDGTITFDVNGPSLYAYNPTEKQYTGVTDNMVSTSDGIMKYQMKFTNDKHGELSGVLTYPNVNAVPHLTKEIGGPNDPTTKLTFDYVEPGHWKRTTILQGKKEPDYDFLQIVDGDGKRTTNYALYLKEAGPDKKLAVVVSPQSDLGKGGPIPPQGGRLTDDRGNDATSTNSRDAADENRDSKTDADSLKAGQSERKPAEGKR